jgi:hypothetical protein
MLSWEAHPCRNKRPKQGAWATVGEISKDAMLAGVRHDSSVGRTIRAGVSAQLEDATSRSEGAYGWTEQGGLLTGTPGSAGC